MQVGKSPEQYKGFMLVKCKYIEAGRISNEYEVILREQKEVLADWLFWKMESPS